MTDWLKSQGIEAVAKFFPDGSIKGSWRIYGKGQEWTPELAEKLNSLGFVNLWHEPLNQFSGSGSIFQVFVRGHYEFIENGEAGPQWAEFAKRWKEKMEGEK